jgi:hypothetical protein
MCVHNTEKILEYYFCRVFNYIINAYGYFCSVEKNGYIKWNNCLGYEKQIIKNKENMMD